MLHYHKQEMGKNYVLQEDLFLTTKDYRTYMLQVPGDTGWIPYSIEEYRLSPNEWWNQPQWKKAFSWSSTPEQAAASAYRVLGVIEAGTVIEVTRLTAFRVNGMGWFYRPMVKIHDPRFCDLEVSASLLLSGEYNHENIYMPFDLKYVKPIESSS
ncbi:MAG: hypothetical protein JSR80_03310 [Verrucomicrobia bacterium]|nr:hypothetical protein [Verrucomicrobiota bacterium]